jgi:hypothetical protein
MEEISYIVTKDDLIAWSTYYNMKTMKTAKGKKWYAGWKWQVLGIILFLVGIFSIVKWDSDLLGIPLLFIGAFLFFLSRGAGSMPSYLKSFLKSSLNKEGAKLYENAGPGLLGQVTLRIEEDGLVSKTAVGEHRGSWEVVGPIISHENYIFISVNRVAAEIINRNRIVRGNLDQFKEKIEKKALVKG